MGVFGAHGTGAIVQYQRCPPGVSTTRLLLSLSSSMRNVTPLRERISMTSSAGRQQRAGVPSCSTARPSPRRPDVSSHKRYKHLVAHFRNEQRAAFPARHHRAQSRPQVTAWARQPRYSHKHTGQIFWIAIVENGGRNRFR